MRPRNKKTPAAPGIGIFPDSDWNGSCSPGFPSSCTQEDNSAPVPSRRSHRGGHRGGMNLVLPMIGRAWIQPNAPCTPGDLQYLVEADHLARQNVGRKMLLHWSMVKGQQRLSTVHGVAHLEIDADSRGLSLPGTICIAYIPSASQDGCKCPPGKF
jgi:hypothetical protein